MRDDPVFDNHEFGLELNDGDRGLRAFMEVVTKQKGLDNEEALLIFKITNQLARERYRNPCV